MTEGSIPAAIIETLLKHLPPSASTLRLLDVNGRVASALVASRADLVVVSAAESSVDAVVVYADTLTDQQLPDLLAKLRPGGRLIAIDPQGSASAARVKQLESAGYTRILVEEMLPNGVLMRGEKPHITADTLARIQSVAALDSAQSEFKGRYVHLLVRQTPNKPVWALRPGDSIEWQAVALAGEADPVLLAFSSLPNAVAFMQPAVIAGGIKDVNKVAKFSRAAAQNWRLLINPSVDVLQSRAIMLVPVDPALAETPDE